MVSLFCVYIIIYLYVHRARWMEEERNEASWMDGSLKLHKGQVYKFINTHSYSKTEKILLLNYTQWRHIFLTASGLVFLMEFTYFSASITSVLLLFVVAVRLWWILAAGMMRTEVIAISHYFSLFFNSSSYTRN